MFFQTILSDGFSWNALAWFSLQCRHNGRDGVSNHRPRHCLLNCILRRRSKKTSKIRVTGSCAGNSPVTGEFPAQIANNAENVSIWWRHHVFKCFKFDANKHLINIFLYNTKRVLNYDEVLIYHSKWHHSNRVFIFDLIKVLPSPPNQFLFVIRGHIVSA